MKGMTHTMTADRMNRALIPVPMPDLHQAPVQFLHIRNFPDFQDQFDLMRQYIESGDFILVEGIDFQHGDAVNTAYLALGGQPFPPDHEQAAVPTQSLRWPRTPILVLCTNPPPILPMLLSILTAWFNF